MTADEQLKLIRKEFNVTQQELAKKLGVPASTISNIENGTREIPKSVMKQMVDLLKLNATWVLMGEGEMFASQNKEVVTASTKIPLLRQSVSCGPGEEWQDADTVEGYVEPMQLIPALQGRRIYAFRAKGTSMVGAGINDGDVILFDGAREQVPTDDLYVFALNGSVFCKLVKFDELTGRIRIYSMHTENIKDAELLRELDPANESDYDTFRLFGRVLAWMHENRLMYR